MTYASTSLAAGVRKEWKYRTPIGLLTPKIRVEFQHEFQNIGSAAVAYSDALTNGWYQIASQASGHNSLVTELGLEIAASKVAKTSLIYNWIHYFSGNNYKQLSLKYSFLY